jgi:hypothetical protein
MSRKRRVLGSKLKAKVALAAIRGGRTLAQLTSHFDLSAVKSLLGKRNC